MEKPKITVQITVVDVNADPKTLRKSGGTVVGICSMNTLDALVHCRSFLEDLQSIHSLPDNSIFNEDESQENFDDLLEMPEIIDVYSNCSAPWDYKADQAIADWKKMCQAVENGPFEDGEALDAVLR